MNSVYGKIRQNNTKAFLECLPIQGPYWGTSSKIQQFTVDDRLQELDDETTRMWKDKKPCQVAEKSVFPLLADKFCKLHKTLSATTTYLESNAYFCVRIPLR